MHSTKLPEPYRSALALGVYPRRDGDIALRSRLFICDLTPAPFASGRAEDRALLIQPDLDLARAGRTDPLLGQQFGRGISRRYQAELFSTLAQAPAAPMSVPRRRGRCFERYATSDEAWPPLAPLPAPINSSTRHQA